MLCDSPTDSKFTLSVGDLRVLYSVNGDIITIKDVLPRGQAYKRL
jgi:mRNA-degrading endonuclease RelE of RelBE toxin-antitoxin system